MLRSFERFLEDLAVRVGPFEEKKENSQSQLANFLFRQKHNGDVLIEIEDNLREVIAGLLVAGCDIGKDLFVRMPSVLQLIKNDPNNYIYTLSGEDLKKYIKERNKIAKIIDQSDSFTELNTSIGEEVKTSLDNEEIAKEVAKKEAEREKAIIKTMQAYAEILEIRKLNSGRYIYQKEDKK